MKLSEIFAHKEEFIAGIKDPKIKKYIDEKAYIFANYLMDDLIWGDKFSDKIIHFLCNSENGTETTHLQFQKIIEFCHKSNENYENCVSQLVQNFESVENVKLVEPKVEQPKVRQPNKYTLAISWISVTNRIIRLQKELRKVDASVSPNWYNPIKKDKIQEKLKLLDITENQISEKIINEESRVNINYLFEKGYGDSFLDYIE